jgi:hypothetical protein
MNLSQIYTDVIAETTVNSFHSVLDQIKNLSPAINNCTHNGFNSHNVISVIPKETIQDIAEKTKKYLNSVVENCIHYEYYIDHIHLIHYSAGGWQEGHTHKSSEDYSFILYLNDSDGDTLIYEGKNIIPITPKRGKIVFFSSHLLHEGTVCVDEKKIAVGSIRLRHKIWKPR